MLRKTPDNQLRTRSHWRRMPLKGLVFLVVVLLCIWIPFFAPYDPQAIDILNRLASPSPSHWLGTDQMGRDVFARLLYGARITVGSALLVVLFAGGIGTLIGALSGYLGGFLDKVVMRLCEGMSVLPALAITMVIAGVLGLGLWAVIVALISVHWTEYARLVRNMVMVEKAKTYIQAAESLGAGRFRIIRHHLLPNIAGPLLTITAFSMSWAILSFAGLSFLGLGVEPGTAEWGRMIAESRSHLRSHPHLVLAPGLAIMALVMAINLFGDAYGDRLRGTHTNPLKSRRS
ncbi:peptide/nickel transport system permease protein [Cohaesibacter marisflavi]|uniref:Peptide/nickel transport system permease protein n=1 Tax=Cohaesibacter marisflavi TaxID=655353 RepID=A0A1I5LIV9_9HYPH|nr:ABC transporter permease [Cohaesibacter marisflavi]SFO97258.1 peptide/nickel transport system permease protein [Cohaesibacter marisflavi]